MEHRLTLLAIFLLGCVWLRAGERARNPYDRQAGEQVQALSAGDAAVRAGAAEALGFLRAYGAEPQLTDLLGDKAGAVRREAALALAWCGGRASVEPLLAALDDRDWSVAQAAWVALTNITGVELPFDALAQPDTRAKQAAAWREWWMTVPPDRPPEDVLALLEGGRPGGLASGCPVTASTTYRGPASVLTDGQIGPSYFQTKNVPFPQWVTVDLLRAATVAQVVVHQYGPRFCMTDYALETSLDGKAFDLVHRRKVKTPPHLVVAFEPRQARYVRITSYASENPTYPTTFFEIEVEKTATPRVEAAEPPARRHERGLRALGALGGKGAAQAIMDYLDPLRGRHGEPVLVEVGLRALGRLRDPRTVPWLIEWLDAVEHARWAAMALGDVGDRRAVPALLAAYPKYAKGLKAQNPKLLPRDDRMGFPSLDRMLHTPYAIAYALCRLPLDDAETGQALRRLAPQILANLPQDHDASMLYEPEVGEILTCWLLEGCGLRQEACEQGFAYLGQPRRVERPAAAPAFPCLNPGQVATWLPALCVEKADVPRLAALLGHRDGWVRINAAKALGFMGHAEGIEPLADALRKSKPEAEFGYSPRFIDEEYNDPAPRWREALLMALGLLKAEGHVPLLAEALNDERNVLEVRFAAAQALAVIGTEEAFSHLRKSGNDHPFATVRQVAQEALWRRCKTLPEPAKTAPGGPEPDARPGSASLLRSRCPSGSLSPQERVRARGEREQDATAGAQRPQAPHRGPLPAGEGVGAAGAGTVGRRGVPDLRKSENSPPTASGLPDAIVFIKGSNVQPNHFQNDHWRRAYVTTDTGPTYRPGRNLYVLSPVRPDGAVRPLTRFEGGYVADCEVSWDGKRVIFCARGAKDPWWHVWEVNADGSELRQLTRGPYHDVQPCYLPDGRIAFASSRIGTRDEYHMYTCTALHLMNPDGSDIHPIAINVGRDNEPSILPDGRIVFARLEVFYSRLKTEITLHAVQPDGFADIVLYGPERRRFWHTLKVGPRGDDHGGNVYATHRVLRQSQPQGLPDGRILCATQGGLTYVGPDRTAEHIIPHDLNRAFTSPFPLPDGRILCASTLKAKRKRDVDLGLYLVEPTAGALTLVYNDPKAADFEPRPLMPRERPPVLPSNAKRHAFTGHFLCLSVHLTQEKGVPTAGRLVRCIEGMPVVGRHSTHTNPQPVWKNHGGAFARVLGTVPLAADGSFHVEVPADRMVHFQVLDSDRRVLGNQLTWIYTRPGEQRSCVGCHEPTDTTPPHRARPQVLATRPIPMLPTGGELRYRAKAWLKGHLPAAVEERTRTVRAVNLLAR